MTDQTEFTLAARSRGCHLITSEVLSHVGDLPETGLLNLFVLHTSCGLTINENCDPDVRLDMTDAMNRIVPQGNLYRHADEGPDDMPSHVKSSIVGASLTIPISNHRLRLGTWQGIYLCEFRDYGGPRRIVATIVG